MDTLTDAKAGCVKFTFIPHRLPRHCFDIEKDLVLPLKARCVYLTIPPTIDPFLTPFRASREPDHSGKRLVLVQSKGTPLTPFLPPPPTHPPSPTPFLVITFK